MPDSPHFGTRFFVILIARAIVLYLRHKPNIDQDLPSGVVDALMVLVDALDAILAANPPGPE